ncbi:MAG: citrate synthase [Ardenticatenaceae bacterium]|nr:citrate synthase [Ardenticatenaceae bacterium]HBY98571.1 citrate synthase [Chloroflexota bacterium]
MSDQASASKGLEGVVVAQTSKSAINGQEGKLAYVGIPIQEFAENHAPYEEVVYLLWYSRLPTRAQLDTFSRELAAQRSLPEPMLTILRDFPRTADPMAVLRTAISALAFYDENPDQLSPENVRRIAASLTAKIPTILAAYYRLRHGQEPVAPRLDLGHAAHFLYMLSGESPGEQSARGLNSYLVLLAEHGMNASTFAARVIAGTLADVYSAITGAIGALKGPSHGGAPPRVMHMLEAVERPELADQWVENALAANQRIMGVGHRVYKTFDPRANILREMVKQVAQERGEARWYELSKAVEDAAVKRLQGKGLYTNVDFYTAPLLGSLGLPTDMFTPLFAMSRIAGWTAHLMEQYADNRLIRPRAEYVGPVDKQYIPFDERRASG